MTQSLGQPCEFYLLSARRRCAGDLEAEQARRCQGGQQQGHCCGARAALRRCSLPRRCTVRGRVLRAPPPPPQQLSTSARRYTATICINRQREAPSRRSTIRTRGACLFSLVLARPRHAVYCKDRRRNLILRSLVSSRSPRVTHFTIPGPRTNICMAGSHTNRRK